MDEYGNTQQEIEFDMITCCLMLEYPDLDYSEILKLAIEELRENYSE